MASIADRLKELRNEAGITQSALAEELGIAMNTLSKWERGESQPNDADDLSGRCFRHERMAAIKQ